MAITAAVAQVHPFPPPARRTAAWSACARIACTAVICLFLASMLLFFYGLAAMEIGWLACGGGCAVVAAGFKVVYVGGVTLVLDLPFLLLVAWMLARARAAAMVPVAAAAATDLEATKVEEPALETSDWAMWVRSELRDPVVIGFLASLVFTMLMLIAVLVIGDSPVQRIMCSMIYHVGSVGMNVVNCFVLCPLITVRVWRSWRTVQQVL